MQTLDNTLHTQSSIYHVGWVELRCTHQIHAINKKDNDINWIGCVQDKKYNQLIFIEFLGTIVGWTELAKSNTFMTRTGPIHCRLD